MHLVHGTTVEIEGRGVLLRGPSGSGKSDLALRLIDGGAVLVSDDQTEVSLENGRLFASPPAVLAGLLEVRGLGIVPVAYCTRAPLALVVDLVDQSARIERLPDPDWAVLHGVSIPRLQLVAFEAAAAAKVRLAVLTPAGTIMRAQ